MKKRLFYAAVAALLLLSLVSCGRDGLPPDESSGGPVPNSSAEVTWEAPDETLSASLAKLLSKHSSKGWYHHIGKADVFRQDGVVRAEITLKEESTKYASASVMLSGFFDTEQMDAFFPGLCGAAEELGFRSADVAEIGKLFYNLTTQDDAQNYARIAGYGLPVYQLLADITGEKVSFVRPPYGSWDKSFEKELNMFPVLWNIDPLDWCSHNAECIAAKVVEKAGDGDIILMHDYYDTSVTAALEVVDVLQKRGFQFVTVEEILFD